MDNIIYSEFFEQSESLQDKRRRVGSKTAKGGYMAQGNDGKGNKMTTILNEAKALQAIADGVAKKGF